METFFKLHKEAKTWHEVEELLKRLMRPTREKWDAAYEEAGRLTSTNGRKHAVFIVGEMQNMGSKLVYSFKTMEISALDSDALALFVEKLGPYQLIRSTIAFSF